MQMIWDGTPKLTEHRTRNIEVLEEVKDHGPGVNAAFGLRGYDDGSGWIFTFRGDTLGSYNEPRFSRKALIRLLDMIDKALAATQ